MGNQDTKQEEDCVIMPVDCRMNDNSKEFQKRKQNGMQREQQKQKKKSVVGGRGIKHLSGRKLKQKITEIKMENMDDSIECRSFDIKMSKADKLFKSLYIVKRFEQKYTKEYPVMILSKSQSIRSLRQQISREKQNHKYFISELLNQLIYYHFTVIQRVQWLFIRIFQTGRHSNVLKILKQMDNEYSINQTKNKLQEIYSFAKYIDTLNIELMDMLYYQLHNSKEQIIQHDIYDINQVNQEKNQQINALKVINVKEEIMKDRLLPQIDKQKVICYESCKQKGWKIYKSNRVCFYILAMENQTVITELQALEIPEKLSILEIILEKYDAFAQMIQVSDLSICILIDEKRKSRFHQLMQQNQQKWKRLNIKILLSEQLPALDIEGNFIFNRMDEIVHLVRMASIGSGDIWNCLRDDLNEMQKFEYVEVIGVRNCLQSGFDCFLLGKSKEEGFEWATKVFEPIERLTELRFMSEGKQSKNNSFYVPQQPIISSNLPHYIINPHQIDYSSELSSVIQSQKPYYVYGNHTLLSTKFIKRVIQKIDKKQQRMYRRKIINQDNSKFIVFQRDFIDDAIQMSLNYEGENMGKWGMFVCEREGSYYPLYSEENGGVFDIRGCSRTLSQNYMSQLNLSVTRFLGFTGCEGISCYIDPHISLQGQQLQDISLQIERRINSLLIENNHQLNQRIDSIHIQTTLQVEQYPMTASRVVASISRIAIMQRRGRLEQQQQIDIYID